MKRILVVEDDLALSTGLCFELDAAGYASLPAYNCAKARCLLAQDAPDLALLDVNLPDGNGFDLCRDIKAVRPELPVIFLTAKSAVKDRVLGLRLGADDYITKPFAAEELVARMETLVITPNEYKLLRFLTDHTGQILTRQQLLDRLWDSAGNFIDDHTLTVTMNRLRAKIEDDAHAYIKTVRGMGYIWTGGRA